MIPYKRMYFCIFNAATDALRALEVQKISCAQEILISAQKKAEEMFLDGEQSSKGKEENS